MPGRYKRAEPLSTTLDALLPLKQETRRLATGLYLVCYTISMERKHKYIGLLALVAVTTLSGCSLPFQHAAVVTPNVPLPATYKLNVDRELSCGSDKKTTIVFRGDVSGDTSRLQKLVLVITDAQVNEVERDTIAYGSDFHFVQISTELPSPGTYTYQFLGDFSNDTPGRLMLNVPITVPAC